MGLSDPFDTTYRGSMQAGMSLGQGINDAAGDVAGEMKLQNQRKQALGFLKQFGMLNTKTEEPSLDELTQGAQDFVTKTQGPGHTLNINYGDNPDEAKQNLMGIYKALNIPMPQGKTTTTLNLAPGTKYDPIQGNVSFDSLSKSLVGELADQKEKDKKENAKLVADAIESGNQLADFQSLYGLAGPVKAELQKRGVDVNKMQLDTLAEKKFVQTINGPAQTRLRQIIPSVTDGLDILDGLNDEFKRSGVKAFNKAQIEALANGAGTKEQQETAQKFITQISVLSDEAGSLFMNGNTPTDKSIELFQKIVGGDYNDTAIRSAIKQLKTNLNIRKNAIENTGAVGLNGPIGNQQNQGQQVLQAGMNNTQQSNGDPLGLR